MRPPSLPWVSLFALATPLCASSVPIEPDAADVAMLRRIHDAALDGSPVYGHLAELVEKHPGRLSGSASLAGAVQWARGVLERQGVNPRELQLGAAALASLVDLVDRHGL